MLISPPELVALASNDLRGLAFFIITKSKNRLFTPTSVIGRKLTEVVVPGSARKSRRSPCPRVCYDGGDLGQVEGSHRDGDVISGVHNHTSSLLLRLKNPKENGSAGQRRTS